MIKYTRLLVGIVVISSILGIFLFPSCSKEGETFQINVQLTDVPEENLIRVDLVNMETKEVFSKEFVGESSIDISFSDSIAKLSFFYLDVTEFILEEKKTIPHLSKKLFIRNEEVTVKGKIDNPKVITDSETQSVLEQWYKESQHIREPLSDLKWDLYEDYKKGDVNTKKFKDGMALREELSTKLKELVVGFIEEHKHSETAAFLLNLNYQNLSMDTLQDLYQTLGETIKNSKYNEPIKIYLTTEVLNLGDYWNDFTAFNTDGDSQLLSEVEQSADKYMLIVFARRGCMPCENSISELKGIYENYHEGLEIVSYYQDITAEELKSKAISNDIEWTFLGTNKKSDRRTMRSYDVEAFPQFVLISPERKLIYSWKKGYEKGSLTEKVKEYLGS